MTDSTFSFGLARYFCDDCFEWLRRAEPQTIHGVVTDPPYGLLEYEAEQLAKREAGSGGVWRVPPSFDGHQRSPLPRFTVLSTSDRQRIREFFEDWARLLLPVLVPGAHVLVASNPLLAHLVTDGLEAAGFELRGQVIRLVQTMRGGDRPKNAHTEFADVTVMPRSMHEPWVLVRKPLQGRVKDNLRRWGTGGLRRPEPARPFGDVIGSAPTRKAEREMAPHPSLKPQAFLRTVVRAILPLGEGCVLDPFAGSGSTLAAANAVGYKSIGVEREPKFAEIARRAIPALSEIEAANPARQAA